MFLPPPDEIDRREYQRNYFISTPTFDLSPIEKPDMSPFLIHMTGKDAILSILQGEEEICEPGEGCILAAIPTYSNSKNTFDAEVVCFTESPTFAVDFFRYRRIERWEADQRFGIGFSKSALVERGVRPIIYLEDGLIAQLINLFLKNEKKIVSFQNKEEEEGLSNAQRRRLQELLELQEILEDIYPLLFPLSEGNRFQGFMWEREWRYFSQSELVFNYQDIEIICCPAAEEPPIREILGSYAEKIVFIRAWDEYSDVTQYLADQQEIWDEQSLRIAQASRQSLRKRQLRKLIKEKQRTLNSIRSYIQFIEQIQRDLEKAKGSEEDLRQEIQKLQDDLSQIEEEQSSE